MSNCLMKPKEKMIKTFMDYNFKQTKKGRAECLHIDTESSDVICIGLTEFLK